MAENRRGKDKRFYFSRGQLMLLGATFVVASLIIFFLGIFVGKGIEERRMAKNDEPSVKIPIKPSQGAGGAPGGQPKEELTFYNTLTKSPPAEPVAEEKPTAAKQPEKVAKAEAKNNKAQTKEEAPAHKVVEKKTEKVLPPANAPLRTQMAEATEQNGGNNGWTVQVNAFPDERSAKIWVDRLKDKGYNAYLTEASNNGKLWYRVRIGNYGTREEANKALETLKSQENFATAFATSR
jgi:DedD protein